MTDPERPADTAPAPGTTGGRLLARNTIWNLASQIIPVLVGLVAVRILIRGLGDERFGILMLAWSAIGYFSLFDLGLGRALTQAVSAAIGSKQDARLGTISATTLLLMFLLGLAGGVFLAAVSPWLIGSFLNIPASLQREALLAFFLMAASLPFVVMTAGLRGLMEAHQHFGTATMLRLPYAVFTFVAPVVILRWTHSVAVIVGVLVVGRIGLWLAHVIVCLREYAFLRTAKIGNYASVAHLLSAGGWMTVSNVLSPIMVSLDRFLIGALLSVAAVTYYVTPYEMVTKLLLIPGAVLGVMFPAFATTYAQSSPKLTRLFDSSVRMMLFLMFPATLLFVIFATEILQLWIGGEFPARSATIMQLLAIGVFINGPGQVGFAGIQAIGRADLSAKLHAIELPAYLATMIFLGNRFGLAGVAVAWSARIAFDTMAMCWLMRGHMPDGSKVVARGLVQLVALSVLLGVGFIPLGLTARLAMGSVILLGFVIIAWRYGLHPEERAIIASMTRRG